MQEDNYFFWKEFLSPEVVEVVILVIDFPAFFLNFFQL